MAGQQSGQPPAGGNSLQQAVIEKLMLAEGALTEAAQLLPALAPIVDGVVSQLRAQAGRALAQSVQPQPQSPAMAIMDAMGGGAGGGAGMSIPAVRPASGTF